jgi:holdfast attachment protein HfaA
MTAFVMPRVKRRAALLAAAACACFSAVGAASAQSMGASSSAFNAGYGRSAGDENRPVNFTLRDTNGNLTIIDGVMNTGSDQSTLAGASIADGGGYAGVGGLYSSGASAIGNNLNVVTSGSHNTVIINSVQTNTGTVTANGYVSNGTAASAN